MRKKISELKRGMIIKSDHFVHGFRAFGHPNCIGITKTPGGGSDTKRADANFVVDRIDPPLPRLSACHYCWCIRLGPDGTLDMERERANEVVCFHDGPANDANDLPIEEVEVVGAFDFERNRIAIRSLP